MERHLFVQEEGAPLQFKGTLFFREPVPKKKAVYLAASMANVHALGRRKTRGKGLCSLDGVFSDRDGSCTETLSSLVKQI